MFDKIKKIVNEKIKLILFVLIFALVCLICSQNTQEINYIFKRGTLLEYSYKTSNLTDEKLSKKLSSFGVKFAYLDKYQNYDGYDFENKKIENKLIIVLPYKLDESKTDFVNQISDYVFKNTQDGKLIGLNSIHNPYHMPYRALQVFFVLITLSLIVWLICLHIFFDFNEIFKQTKINVKNLYTEKKEALIQFFKKTKEKGFVYFLKKILFDNVTDENEKDMKFGVEIVKTLAFVIFCVVIIRYFIGELRWIPTGSMRPVILERDRVFVEKLDFPYHKEVKRGDILVFYPPDVELSNSPLAILSRLSGIFCKDVAYIKRLIALPNEKFEVKQNILGEYQVYINDIPLQEPYINSKIDWTPCKKEMFCGPFVVPEGHYFMMGDNRGNSQDSRFWGFLDKNRVIGRANFMFYPFSRINFLKDNYLELNKNKKEKYNYIINRY